jgi:DNA-binding IclR family transcriptional regulator
MSSLPAQPNKSLIDGITILQALAINKDPVSGVQLSQEFNLELTRVNRILKTLAYLGIAYKTNSRKYTTGPGMHVLAAQSLYASGLIQRAIKPLEKLNKYGCIVAMGVLWRTNVSYLYLWSPGMRTIEALGRLTLYPASASSIGLVLLADKTDEHIKQLYCNKSIPDYPKGIDDLLKTIRKTREHGFSEIIHKKSEARIHGGKSLAVKFGEPTYAAVALSGEIKSLDVQKYIQTLSDTIAKIERI